MKDKKKIPFGTTFGVAAVWFGAHVGGGFATGNQTRAFFVRFGYSSIFLPMIIILLIGFVYYEGLLLLKIIMNIIIIIGLKNFMHLMEKFQDIFLI